MKRMGFAIAVIAGLCIGSNISAIAGGNLFWEQVVALDSAGESAWDADSLGTNTGVAHSSIWWEEIEVIFRFTSGGTDSVDVVLQFEQSLDGTNWFLVDSTSLISDSSYYKHRITDSLHVLPWFRTLLQGRAGTAHSGVTGTVDLSIKGHKE